MEELTLATPSILFSAVSLIMLAYTNRFLAYAQIIRNISAEYQKTQSPSIPPQIANLRRRLYMMRTMQILGILSLLLCVASTFLIYVGHQKGAVWLFAVALVSLIVSLGVSIVEIQISCKALDIHLCDIDRKGKNC